MTAVAPLAPPPDALPDRLPHAATLMSSGTCDFAFNLNCVRCEKVLTTSAAICVLALTISRGQRRLVAQCDGVLRLVFEVSQTNNRQTTYLSLE